MSSDVMRSIPLICDSRGHSPLSSMPASSNHLIHLITFLSSPRPLSLALSCLLALNNPPPPGVGGADGRTICDCWRGVDLLASHHAVPFSRSCSFATAAALVIVSPDIIAVALPADCFVIAPVAHRACGSCPSPPLAPPGLSRNGEGLRTDCGLFGCHRLACLPNAVSPSRVIWLDCFHLAPVVISCGLASCFLACADGGVRAMAPCGIASTASPLERFNHF